MNRVGLEGQGESVWLGWFLVDVLQRWAGILEELGNAPRAQSFRQRAADYTAALEKAAWDGAWYTRAFYDDGTPLGAANGDEPRIDAIAQSWAVLSGAGDPAHSRAAMAAVAERLVHPDERLSLLFTPPFDGTGHDPGYISDYPPGIRENGGQYTHAATWTAWAFAALGDGERAAALLEMLCPVGYSDSPEAIERYRVEPYVIAADVHSQPPYVGRGGWTGTPAWGWAGAWASRACWACIRRRIPCALRRPSRRLGRLRDPLPPRQSALHNPGGEPGARGRRCARDHAGRRTANRRGHPAEGRWPRAHGRGGPGRVTLQRCRLRVAGSKVSRPQRRHKCALPPSWTADIPVGSGSRRLTA